MPGVLEQNIDRLKAGWRMVPREPTDEMLKAGHAAVGKLNYDPPDAEYIEVAAEAWRAMFDAFQASA
jgi:hypothetical protein